MKTSGSSVARHSRRSFLKTTAAVAAPMVVPGSVLGLNGQTAPSNKIVMAGAGWGMQGPGNMGNFMNEDDCQVVAFCDVDKRHLKQAIDEINKRNGNQDCKAYHDYREMMARADIDAVMLALPDNWHALVSARGGRTNKKDIFGEKPLARTIPSSRRS
jgi:predicted dehydrogenase